MAVSQPRHVCNVCREPNERGAFTCKRAECVATYARRSRVRAAGKLISGMDEGTLICPCGARIDISDGMNWSRDQERFNEWAEQHDHAPLA